MQIRESFGHAQFAQGMMSMMHTRRKVVGAMIGGTLVAGGVARTAVANSGAQLPTWGNEDARAGALGLATAAAPMTEIPVAIEIPDADVNAEIEINKIVDGQMLDPTGPWIVSWYEGTGLLHEPGRNILMSGHVDYWGVGPAIFWTVASLQQGATVTVYGDRGGASTYEVEYVERINNRTITTEKLAEITGRTDYEALTLITCGGTFDYDAGEYVERDIVRCRLLENQPGDQAPSSDVPVVQETPSAPARPDGQPSSITQDGVNMRSDASTAGDPLQVLAAGTHVTVFGDPVEAEGYTWYPIRLDDGTEGWVVGDFLDLAQ
jgi:sortase (surface protein transpeptidase)